MEDHILESLFLDTSLWAEVLDWGVRKGIPPFALQYIQDPHGRAELCEQVGSGEYLVPPPHTGYAPKESGGERTFFVNDPLSRLLFHAIYLWLMRHESGMVHDACLSYRQGIGIGRIVLDVSSRIQQLGIEHEEGVVGRKFDIHHYFDTIPREYIHQALDRVEEHHGASSVVDLIRSYYDSDLYWDSRQGAMVEAYQGIKQGCAISSWFANAILYPLDEALASLGECYVRYSDDILYVGTKYEEATEIIRSHLQGMGLQLNDQKTEEVIPTRFVRFLGFHIRGSEVTLSPKWVKQFQRNIDQLTIRDARLVARVRRFRRLSDAASQRQLEQLVESTLRRVARFLYYGNGSHSWGQLVLPFMTRAEDVRCLNLYCLDALRAVCTGRTHIGGLGKSPQGGIVRGKGRNVKANRASTQAFFPGYRSLHAMQACLSNPWLYRALVCHLLLPTSQADESPAAPCPTLEELEETYERYLLSQPDGQVLRRYYARSLSELTLEDLMEGQSRCDTYQELESLVQSFSSFADIDPQPEHWFWQSEQHPELIILKEWFS